MAVTDNYSPSVTAGNGTTDEFSDSWRIIAETDLVVELRDTTTGAIDTQDLGADYSVEFDTTGFTVTFVTPPPSGKNVVIYRSIPIIQPTPYRTVNGFDGSVQEKSYDRLTLITQDLADNVGRSLKFLDGTAFAGKLPTPSDGFGIIWDGASGDMKNTSSSLSVLEGNAQTVADNIANINTVAGIDSDVTTAAGDSADIQAVAGISADVQAVSTNNTNVTLVADDISSVVTVADDITSVVTVADDLNGADTIGDAATFVTTYPSLVDIGGLDDSDGNIIVGSAAGWVAESGATARTSLGLGTGDTVTFTQARAGAFRSTSSGGGQLQSNGGTVCATFGAGGGNNITLPNVDINGGAIDGTTIGANSPAAGTFTSIDTGNGAVELYPASTYTPSFTLVNNVSAATIVGAPIVQRQDNIVDVMMAVDVTTSGSGDTYFDIDLPIASTLSDTDDLIGTVGSTVNSGTPVGTVYAQTSTNRARVRFGATVAATRAQLITLRYRVV
jgi:hypothetical protein